MNTAGKLEIREIDIWSVVKVCFFVFIVIGLVMGAFSLVAMMMIGTITNALVGEMAAGMISGAFSGIIGLVSAVFIVVFYAVFGTIFSFILAFFYNIIARLMGGITVTVVPVTGAPVQPVAGSAQVIPPQAETPQTGPADEQ